MYADGKLQVLPHEQQTVERELLRHIAKLAFGRAGRPAQVQPHHMRLAAGGFEQAAQHLEGGRFAGAVRPEQAEDFAFADLRSEEHTSELQSLMRHSYAVFCLKKKK